ncbi:hypothetical protein L0666_02555 [Octadecabacter sp. CECT 8868]|uniref:hypothetical protein n=1 Tax=Octadecabacter algicola TaxID=2909342 RepID=UPI001F1CF834|nr:hypothetical protein [Octadecabacter algicola]MCF2903856.1 hypothetical protein [Octadecabacter algicola]
MTETSTQPPNMPLGVGDIISSSFSIMFGNFFKVFILGFIGAFLGFIVNFLFLGFGAATGTDLTGSTASVLPTIISIVINMVVYGLVTALLIQLAYDAKLGRSSSIGEYFSSALPAIVPIVVLSVAIGILSMAGAIALIIGALWVYAVFYVMAPVAVIERGGFGSMGRSAELTKEYRWPIVGLFILVGVVSIALTFVAGFVVAILASIGGPIFAGIGLAMINGLSYAFGGIVVALVYARLREIKEGVDVDQIASVFD